MKITNNEENVLIDVFDIMGKKVFTQNNRNAKIIIDIKDQPQGIYLVKITIGGQVFNEKLIRN